GDARIEGCVEGDVVSFGGDVTIGATGEVRGEVVTMGGRLRLEEGASLSASPRALPGGAAAGQRGRWPRAWARSRGAPSGRHSWLGAAFRSATSHGLLFLLGLLLLGLGRPRLGRLQRAIVERPLGSALAGMLGLLAIPILILVLVITIVGIPGALLLLLLTFVAGCVGAVAIATVLGAALPIAWLRGRPVAQLAAGLGLLFLLSLVPWIGALVFSVALIVGLGAIVLTRFGDPRSEPSEVPAPGLQEPLG
ncbi:MAG: polymer-forming cytoskeletal protein, partial [Myxococcales bacterium]|nr:polymer-forming cytoskeletal protein [Myxococcales bacterium]